MVRNNMIYNERISGALNYANDLKHQINYKHIINGDYDHLIEFNAILEETLEFYIMIEEYELCQNLINKKNKKHE